MVSEDDVLINIETDLTGDAADKLKAEADQAQALLDKFNSLTTGQQQTGAAGQTMGQMIAQAVDQAKAKVLEATDALNQARQAALTSTADQAQQTLAAVTQAQQAVNQAMTQQGQALAYQQQMQAQQGSAANPYVYDQAAIDAMNQQAANQDTAGQQQEQAANAQQTHNAMFGIAMAGGGNVHHLMRMGSALAGNQGPLGVVGAGVGLAESAVNSLSKALVDMGDTSKTTEQKVRDTTSGIPIIGAFVGAILNLNDAIMGTTQRLRENADAFKQSQDALAYRTSVNANQTAYEHAVFKLTQEADIAASVSPNYGEAPDPNTDLVGYKRWLANIPFAQQQAKQLEAGMQAQGLEKYLQADQAAMVQSTVGADVAIAQAWKTMQAQQGQVWSTTGMAGGQYVDVSTVADRDAAQKRALIALDADIANRQALGQNLQQQVQQVGIVVQNSPEALARAAVVNTMNQDLNQLNSEIGVAKQQTTVLGGMDEASRLAVQQAQQQFQDFGLESLSDAQKQLMTQAGGGQWLQQQYLAAGQSDDNAQLNQAIKDGFALVGDQYGGQSLADMQTQAKEMKGDILIQVKIDEELLKEEMKKALQGLAKDIKINADKIAADQKSRKQIEEMQARPNKT